MEEMKYYRWNDGRLVDSGVLAYYWKLVQEYRPDISREEWDAHIKATFAPQLITKEEFDREYIKKLEEWPY